MRRNRVTPGMMLCIAGLVSALPQPAQAQNNGPAGGARPRRLTRQAWAQIEALRREKLSWTPTQRKIASRLLLTTKRRLRRPIAAGVPTPRASIEIDANNNTLVDIKAVVTDALLKRIGALGGTVINHFARYGAIRARVPLAQIEVLAAEADVRSIRPADQFMTNAINVSEGDVAHTADTARTTFSVDGAGINVGVLSDSVDSLAGLQSSGDLPATVTVLVGQSGNPGTSEGTAMLEIVHDLAPGAGLFFATGTAGRASMAANIIALQSAGCRVIVDDIGYFATPVFQDGIIAQAVETVTAAGAVYFSAAGNGGNKSDGTSGTWEGDFVATTAPPVIPPGLTGDAHDFGGGVNFNTITADSPFVFTLQWSDPLGGSASDYDLYLLDPTLTTIIDQSIDPQDGTQDPIEILPSDTLNDTGNVLVIIRFSGTGRFLHLNTHRGRLAVNTGGQTWGHSAAANAFSIAAVNVARAAGGVFDGTEPVERFSSGGPRRVFFEADGTPITPGNFSSTGGTVRQKPDLAAADGVATATPGFGTFFGTSAAAPHAAAIAALLLDLNPTLTPSGVRSVLTGTALDIEAPGVDPDSGFGIIDARAALCSATGPDCNNNGVSDLCELAGNDANGNGVPDECEPAVRVTSPATLAALILLVAATGAVLLRRRSSSIGASAKQ